MERHEIVKCCEHGSCLFKILGLQFSIQSARTANGGLSCFSLSAFAVYPASLHLLRCHIHKTVYEDDMIIYFILVEIVF
jgi:hypothetical protein